MTDNKCQETDVEFYVTASFTVKALSARYAEKSVVERLPLTARDITIRAVPFSEVSSKPQCSCQVAWDFRCRRHGRNA